MNPDTNRFEPLSDLEGQLRRKNDTPILLKPGDVVSIEYWEFRILRIENNTILLEPID